MNSLHKFCQSIINAQKTILKGDIHFTESKGKWSVEVNAVWNKRINRITIRARNSDFSQDFPYCKLFKAKFLTLVSYMMMRSESYSFKGERSVFSETMLSSKAVIPLMETKNPIIELKDSFLIFSGGIRSKDYKSLSNIFILFDVLLAEIDQVITNNLPKQ
ncbi:hypothetical protein KORDIASMS9_00704 [Kordia sp. SMS9]|uniref:hypothetical protein n=1 Tax=Kordia sp. SMS9 TaxID=2282170 RepID=UPI000E0D167E|nr:hypothetical protein [Kordia sp. SMS9]AXG68489.1 hypothetical protein KORDIASMS9_00704 [Kordia sp. SMS9]